MALNMINDIRIYFEGSQLRENHSIPSNSIFKNLIGFTSFIFSFILLHLLYHSSSNFNSFEFFGTFEKRLVTLFQCDNHFSIFSGGIKLKYDKL